jgi:hypothetical protein
MNKLKIHRCLLTSLSFFGKMTALLIILVISQSVQLAASGNDDHDDGHNSNSSNCGNGNNHNYNNRCRHRNCNHTHDCERHGCHREHCPTELYVVDPNVNLGTFFTNTTNDLPSYTGEGNVLEFVLKGDREKTYDVEYDFENVCEMGIGYAKVTDWTWEAADYWTNGRYGHCYRHRHHCHYGMRFYHHNCGSQEERCDYVSKFRLTALKIYISPNATPGPVTFEVTLRVTTCI